MGLRHEKDQVDGSPKFLFPSSERGFHFCPFGSVAINTRQRRDSNFIMQAANRLQKALRTGSGLTFGAWQMLPGSNQARTIACCGFDWVLVDTEHGNIDGTRSNWPTRV